MSLKTKKAAPKNSKVRTKSKKREIKKISNLRELNFGVFEGLTYKEIMQRHAEIYRKWLDDPFRTRIPGGEDLNARRKRVVKAFKKIISYNSGKTIAVISHGGVISIFINAILKSKEFWKFIPKLGSISIVEAKNGKLKVSLFNDTKHLNG